MRDAVITRINQHQELVITTDGCTGVGMLAADIIKAPLDIAAAAAARVALMELLSLGAEPIGYAFNHAADISRYSETAVGFQRTFTEFGFKDVPCISSSEKNFEVCQSTVAIAITGVRKARPERHRYPTVWVVVGSPQVGEEVLLFPHRAITPSEFLKLRDMAGVYEIIPAGSGGIAGELEALGITKAQADIDLNKSAGPASCVLAAVDLSALEEIQESFGGKVHLLRIGDND